MKQTLVLVYRLELGVSVTLKEEKLNNLDQNSQENAVIRGI